MLTLSCGDVTRLRIYSYDSNAYINYDAIAYESIIVKKLKETTSHNRPLKLNCSTQNKGDDVKTGFYTILAKIEESSIDITETYEQWFQISCAFANEFGEYGREMFHQVSRYYTKYNANETNKMFNSCLNAGYRYTLGTFFYWAEQYNLK